MTRRYITRDNYDAEAVTQMLVNNQITTLDEALRLLQESNHVVYRLSDKLDRIKGALRTIRVLGEG